MVTMTKAIKNDVDSGQHGDWEKMYRKICDAVKMSDEEEYEVNSNSNEDYDSVLYCEV